MTEPTRQRRSGWILLVVVLIPYGLIKLQAWSYANQAQRLDRELNQLRPALSAIVLSEQLKKTQAACAQVAVQVRRLDLKNGRLLEQLSHLPPSISLNRLENRVRSRTSLQQLFSGTETEASRQMDDLWVEGTLLPGARDPEGVLVLWAHSLQTAGVEVEIQRFLPSSLDAGAWLFELHLKEA